MKPIPVGAKGSYAKTVETADLASSLDSSLERFGSGTHRRAVIDAAKFNDRLKPKQKS
jgi:predicted thioesterase